MWYYKLILKREFNFLINCVATPTPDTFFFRGEKNSSAYNLQTVSINILFVFKLNL